MPSRPDARTIALLFIFGGLHAATTEAAQIVLTPVADVTLIQDASGSRANGAADSIFAGNTQRDGARRALMRFDLSAIPPGSNVTSASLTLQLARTRPESDTYNLHRVTAAWGEGASNYVLGPGASAAGLGGPAAAGDATWLHRFFGTTQLWGSPGGDFVSTPSASSTVNSSLGSYVWTSTQMQADVHGWLTTPASNHGWLLNMPIGGSAKAFASRENADTLLRPRLTITYEAPAPTEDGDVPLPAWAIGLLGLACARMLQRRMAA